MKKVLSLITVAILSTQACAGGDIEAGKAKSQSCAGCHGSNGKAAIASYPNLAGQNQGYIVLALKAYKTKKRTGGQAGVMSAISAGLSEDDMDNLAAYYHSLK